MNTFQSKEYGLLLYSTEIESPLGPLLAIASEKALYHLEFINQANFDKKKIKVNWSTMIPERNPILKNLATELDQYFKGQLFEFNIPIELKGTDFQRNVWKTLRKIPYGQTISYKEEAELIGNAKSCRAVASANGANPVPIIIPCHRVINHDNKLGGYSSGLEKKTFLLELERKYLTYNNIENKPNN